MQTKGQRIMLADIAVPYHSLLVIIRHDFIERNTRNLLVVFQLLLAASVDLGRLAEPYTFFWIDLPLLIRKWCL